MGFLDKAKQLAEEAAAKAKLVAADLQDMSGPAMEKAKQGAADHHRVLPDAGRRNRQRPRRWLRGRGRGRARTRAIGCPLRPAARPARGRVRRVS